MFLDLPDLRLDLLVRGTDPRIKIRISVPKCHGSATLIQQVWAFKECGPSKVILFSVTEHLRHKLMLLPSLLHFMTKIKNKQPPATDDPYPFIPHMAITLNLSYIGAYACIL